MYNNFFEPLFEKSDVNIISNKILFDIGEYIDQQSEENLSNVQNSLQLLRFCLQIKPLQIELLNNHNLKTKLELAKVRIPLLDQILKNILERVSQSDQDINTDLDLSIFIILPKLNNDYIQLYLRIFRIHILYYEQLHQILDLENENNSIILQSWFQNLIKILTQTNSEFRDRILDIITYLIRQQLKLINFLFEFNILPILLKFLEQDQSTIRNLVLIRDIVEYNLMEQKEIDTQEIINQMRILITKKNDQKQVLILISQILAALGEEQKEQNLNFDESTNEDQIVENVEQICLMAISDQIQYNENLFDKLEQILQSHTLSEQNLISITYIFEKFIPELSSGQSKRLVQTILNIVTQKIDVQINITYKVQTAYFHLLVNLNQKFRNIVSQDQLQILKLFHSEDVRIMRQLEEMQRFNNKVFKRFGNFNSMQSSGFMTSSIRQSVKSQDSPSQDNKDLEMHMDQLITLNIQQKKLERVIACLQEFIQNTKENSDIIYKYQHDIIELYILYPTHEIIREQTKSLLQQLDVKSQIQNFFEDIEQYDTQEQLYFLAAFSLFPQYFDQYQKIIFKLITNWVIIRIKASEIKKLLITCINLKLSQRQLINFFLKALNKNDDIQLEILIFTYFFQQNKVLTEDQLYQMLDQQQKNVQYDLSVENVSSQYIIWLQQYIRLASLNWNQLIQQQIQQILQFERQSITLFQSFMICSILYISISQNDFQEEQIQEFIKQINLVDLFNKIFENLQQTQNQEIIQQSLLIQNQFQQSIQILNHVIKKQFLLKQIYEKQLIQSFQQTFIFFVQKIIQSNQTQPDFIMQQLIVVMKSILEENELMQIFDFKQLLQQLQKYLKYIKDIKSNLQFIKLILNLLIQLFQWNKAKTYYKVALLKDNILVDLAAVYPQTQDQLQQILIILVGQSQFDQNYSQKFLQMNQVNQELEKQELIRDLADQFVNEILFQSIQKQEVQNQIINPFQDSSSSSSSSDEKKKQEFMSHNIEFQVSQQVQQEVNSIKSKTNKSSKSSLSRSSKSSSNNNNTSSANFLIQKPFEEDNFQVIQQQNQNLEVQQQNQSSSSSSSENHRAQKLVKAKIVTKNLKQKSSSSSSSSSEQNDTKQKKQNEQIQAGPVQIVEAIVIEKQVEKKIEQVSDSKLKLKLLREKKMREEEEKQKQIEKEQIELQQQQAQEQRLKELQKQKQKEHEIQEQTRLQQQEQERLALLELELQRKKIQDDEKLRFQEQERIQKLEFERQQNLLQQERQRLLEEQERQRILEQQEKQRQLEELEKQRVFEQQERLRLLELERLQKLEFERQQSLEQQERQRLLEQQERQRVLDQQERQRQLEEQERQRILEQQEKLRLLEIERLSKLELERQQNLDQQERQRQLEEQERQRVLEQQEKLGLLELERLSKLELERQQIEQQERKRQLEEQERQRILEEQERQRILEQQEKLRLQEQERLQKLEFERQNQQKIKENDNQKQEFQKVELKGQQENLSFEYNISRFQTDFNEEQFYTANPGIQEPEAKTFAYFYEVPEQNLVFQEQQQNFEIKIRTEAPDNQQFEYQINNPISTQEQINQINQQNEIHEKDRLLKEATLMTGYKIVQQENQNHQFNQNLQQSQIEEVKQVTYQEAPQLNFEEKPQQNQQKKVSSRSSSSHSSSSKDSQKKQHKDKKGLHVAKAIVEAKIVEKVIHDERQKHEAKEEKIQKQDQKSKVEAEKQKKEQEKLSKKEQEKQQKELEKQQKQEALKQKQLEEKKKQELEKQQKLDAQKQKQEAAKLKREAEEKKKEEEKQKKLAEKQKKEQEKDKGKDKDKKLHKSLSKEIIKDVAAVEVIKKVEHENAQQHEKQLPKQQQVEVQIKVPQQNQEQLQHVDNQPNNLRESDIHINNDQQVQQLKIQLDSQLIHQQEQTANLYQLNQNTSVQPQVTQIQEHIQQSSNQQLQQPQPQLELQSTPKNQEKVKEALIAQQIIVQPTQQQQQVQDQKKQEKVLEALVVEKGVEILIEEKHEKKFEQKQPQLQQTISFEVPYQQQTQQIQLQKNQIFVVNDQNVDQQIKSNKNKQKRSSSSSSSSSKSNDEKKKKKVVKAVVLEQSLQIEKQENIEQPILQQLVIKEEQNLLLNQQEFQVPIIDQQNQIQDLEFENPKNIVAFEQRYEINYESQNIQLNLQQNEFDIQESQRTAAFEQNNPEIQEFQTNQLIISADENQEFQYQSSLIQENREQEYISYQQEIAEKREQSVYASPQQDSYQDQSQNDIVIQDNFKPSVGKWQFNSIAESLQALKLISENQQHSSKIPLVVNQLIQLILSEEDAKQCHKLDITNIILFLYSQASDYSEELEILILVIFQFEQALIEYEQQIKFSDIQIAKVTINLVKIITKASNTKYMKNRMINQKDIIIFINFLEDCWNEQLVSALFICLEKYCTNSKAAQLLYQYGLITQIKKWLSSLQKESYQLIGSLCLYSFAQKDFNEQQFHQIIQKSITDQDLEVKINTYYALSALCYNNKNLQQQLIETDLLFVILVDLEKRQESQLIESIAQLLTNLLFKIDQKKVEMRILIQFLKKQLEYQTTYQVQLWIIRTFQTICLQRQNVLLLISESALDLFKKLLQNKQLLKDILRLFSIISAQQLLPYEFIIIVKQILAQNKEDVLIVEIILTIINSQLKLYSKKICTLDNLQLFSQLLEMYRTNKKIMIIILIIISNLANDRENHSTISKSVIYTAIEFYQDSEEIIRFCDKIKSAIQQQNNQQQPVIKFSKQIIIDNPVDKLARGFPILVFNSTSDTRTGYLKVLPQNELFFQENNGDIKDRYRIKYVIDMNFKPSPESSEYRAYCSSRFFKKDLFFTIRGKFNQKFNSITGQTLLIEQKAELTQILENLFGKNGF